MPIIIEKEKPNPLRLRNKTKSGDLGITTVTISMPYILKVKLDATLEKDENGRPMGRSALICKLIRQYLAKKQERDPRFLLQQKRKELEELQRTYEIEKLKLEAEIQRLEKEAEEKMKGLLE